MNKGFDPNQPRDPEGTDTGGQWTVAGNAARKAAGLEVKNKLDEHVVEQIHALMNNPNRHQYQNGKTDGYPVVPYGDIETVVATGRAICKACGKRIDKGEAEYKFSFDFRGSGSWTAQTVHIHARNCLNKP
jgi:hypothetical protein